MSSCRKTTINWSLRLTFLVSFLTTRRSVKRLFVAVYKYLSTIIFGIHINNLVAVEERATRSVQCRFYMYQKKVGPLFRSHGFFGRLALLRGTTSVVCKPSIPSHAPRPARALSIRLSRACPSPLRKRARRVRTRAWPCRRARSQSPPRRWALLAPGLRPPPGAAPRRQLVSTVTGRRAASHVRRSLAHAKRHAALHRSSEPLHVWARLSTT